MKISALVLCILSSLVLSIYAQGETKEGHCPFISPELIGTCSKDCEMDGECPGAQRCCRNACGGTHCVDIEVEDPCLDNSKCTHPLQECVNEGTHSVCKCPEMCTDEYAPVCGIFDDNDGEAPEEYSNQCYMSVKACKLGKIVSEVVCKANDVKEDIKDVIEKTLDSVGIDIDGGAVSKEACLVLTLLSSVVVIALQ